jgi:hypothetical protein
MKKIIVSAGLVAVSAAGIQNVFADGSDIISPKAWSVSGTLRGFYDDNYAIGTQKKGSFGWEVSPSVSLNLPFQQTDIGFRYTYGFYYYQDRQDIGAKAFDQTHQVEFWLDHAFNERWKVNVTDTFAVGQEPELLNSQTSQQYRVEGNNMANHAHISLDTEWTRQFSTTLRYGNSFFDYQNKGATVSTFFPSVGVSNPTADVGYNDGLFRSISSTSLAGLLNRVEQNVGFDLNWTLQTETVLFVGYNFCLSTYTGNEAIGVYNYFDASSNARSLVYQSDSRNSLSHYGYVGVSHQFTANISGTARVGASFTDSFNDPLQNSTSISPYADMSISYTYIPGSYVQLGVTHDLNATDVASVNKDTGSLTQYQESTVIYTSINHKFTQDLIGTIIGRYQMSNFKGGANDNTSDQTIGVGVNLHYQISQHFSTEVGYNFDDLQSKLQGRSYQRNRVYLGFGANY